MADSDRWLTLGDAVAATGWKPERIRSLARRGTIIRRRGNGRDWLYQITPEVVEARASTMADPSAGTTETAQSEVADLREEVAELRAEIERWRCTAEERGQALAKAEGRLLEADKVTVTLRELIDELRAQISRERGRRHEAEAELRRPWWRRLIGS
jgi:hypothetical protein